MHKRKGWSNLSDAQRKRYVSAGRTGTLSGEPFLSEAEVRSYYEAGGDLQAGRGHKRPRPAWAAPAGPTDLAKVNLLTIDAKKQLAKWRASRSAPKWLPKSPERMRTDVAAILSEFDAPPGRWASVTVRAKGNGRYWLFIQARGRDHAWETTLPDYDAVVEVGRLLNDYSRMTLSKGPERKRLEREWRSARGKPLHIKVDISDTDVHARKVNARTRLPEPKNAAAALKVKKPVAKKKSPTPKARKKS